jgi:hypothetical protein
VQDALHSLPVTTDTVAALLTPPAPAAASVGEPTPRGKGRKRDAAAEAPRPAAGADEAEWLARATVALETAQAHDALATAPALLQPLSRLLVWLQEVPATSPLGARRRCVPTVGIRLTRGSWFPTEAGAEYARQVALQGALTIVSALAADTPRAIASLDVDAVVQVIRSTLLAPACCCMMLGLSARTASTNPQTTGSALLLLGAVARVAPQRAVQHAMAIFTLMGASLVRSDSNYTFEVIEKVQQFPVPRSPSPR